MKTLLVKYLELLGKNIKESDTVLNVNDIPQNEEFENAFKKIPRSANASGFVDKAVVQMSGSLAKVKPCKIIHLKMNSLQLKEISQKYNTTVTVYLLALMFLAGKAATDELTGEMSIQVPVNMRKFYPSKTLRNFSMYCGIRIQIEDIKDLNSLTEKISMQLAQKSSKEEMDKMLSATEKMVNMLKYVPLAAKQSIAKAVYGFLGDKIFSNTLSNLGVVELPKCVSEQIESMNFVLGPGIENRAGCSVVTVNDTAVFSIDKTTSDPTFEEKMYELLSKDGIEVIAEGSMNYEN